MTRYYFAILGVAFLIAVPVFSTFEAAHDPADRTVRLATPTAGPAVVRY